MVTLREALRSDIEGIYQIEKACFSTPWSKEALLDDLEVEDKLYLVAEAEDGKIIGYAGSIRNDYRAISNAVPYLRCERYYG